MKRVTHLNVHHFQMILLQPFGIEQPESEGIDKLPLLAQAAAYQQVAQAWVLATTSAVSF